eukprot:352421-Chlamydomonas_euryale.AAC.81
MSCVRPLARAIRPIASEPGPVLIRSPAGVRLRQLDEIRRPPRALVIVKRRRARLPVQALRRRGVDDNDINAQKNLKGGVDSVFTPERDVVEPTPFAPYSEVFGLQRFRENELIHGRWAMLACLGVFVAEGTTGVSW